MMKDIFRNIILVIILILVGVFNNIMDMVDYYYFISYFKDKNFQFWNKDISWKNKYKDWLEDKCFVYLGVISWLVWIIDVWYLFKIFFLSLFILVIIFYWR